MKSQKELAMKPSAILISFILCLLSTATLAQEVHYNYDRDADFGAYKTYQWIDRDAAIGNPLFDKDIRRAIDGQLSQKGLRKVESSGDVRIQYQTAIDREKQVDA